MSWEATTPVPRSKREKLELFFGKKAGKRHERWLDNGGVIRTEVKSCAESNGVALCISRLTEYSCDDPKQYVIHDSGWQLDLIAVRTGRDRFYWRRLSENQILSGALDTLSLSHRFLDTLDEHVPLPEETAAAQSHLQWRAKLRHTAQLKSLLTELEPGSVLRCREALTFKNGVTEDTFYILEKGSSVFGGARTPGNYKVPKMYLYDFEVLKFT